MLKEEFKVFDEDLETEETGMNAGSGKKEPSSALPIINEEEAM